MKYIKINEFFHDVFGKKQSVLELIAVFVFSFLATYFIYNNYSNDTQGVLSWKIIAAFILVADIMAGCISNFTFSTNQHYVKQSKKRLLFILFHIHLLVISFLLDAYFVYAFVFTVYTIGAACIVNALIGKRIQRFIAANLMFYGLIMILYFSLPLWFILISLFFMIKLVFSFSVNHYEVSILNNN